MLTCGAVQLDHQRGQSCLTAVHSEGLGHMCSNSNLQARSKTPDFTGIDQLPHWNTKRAP